MHAELDRADETDDHRGERDVEKGQATRIALLEGPYVPDADVHMGRRGDLGPGLGQQLGHRRARRTGHIQFDAPPPGPHDGEFPLVLDGLRGRGRGAVPGQPEGAVQGLLHTRDEGALRDAGPEADHGRGDVPRRRIGHDVGVRAGEQPGGRGDDEGQDHGGEERRRLGRRPPLLPGGRPSPGAVRGPAAVLVGLLRHGHHARTADRHRPVQITRPRAVFRRPSANGSPHDSAR